MAGPVTVSPVCQGSSCSGMEKTRLYFQVCVPVSLVFAAYGTEPGAHYRTVISLLATSLVLWKIWTQGISELLRLCRNLQYTFLNFQSN